MKRKVELEEPLEFTDGVLAQAREPGALERGR